MSIIRIANTAELSREEWLEARRQGIGGSDAGAIVGLNSYATPWTVWADKMGLSEDKEDNEAMRIGRDLEQYVADRFTEATGLKTRKVNAILRNEQFPFALANLDRVLVRSDSEPDSGLECKTTNAWHTKQYADGEFPDSYYCQCVHYLAVTGRSRWYLAVLVLGTGFHVFRMTKIKDDPMEDWLDGSVYVEQSEIDALMSAEKDFWENHVLAKVPPAADGQEASTKVLQDHIGGTVEAKVEIGCVEAVQSYMDLGADIKALEEQQEKMKQIILLELSGAEKGSCGAWDISNTRTVSNRFDTKAFKADHASMDLSKYNKVSESVRFNVKARKK